jgi:hypothetical protein
MRGRSWGLPGCLLLALLLAPPPSNAESGHQAKDQGDAPAAIDITGIRANNAQRRVKVRLDVPGLTRRGSFTVTYESARYDGMAIVIRNHKRGVTWRAFHCGEDSCTKVECSGVHVWWNLAQRYVGASVPQSCYPLAVPDAWSFNGHSDLGDDYDSTYTNLRLRRG